MYLDAFDHYVKETLLVKHYIRYTDDAVIFNEDKKYLSLLRPVLEHWLWQNRRLKFHPRKVEIRKLRQGIDFLGYVTLPHHRVLRTKTKHRMLKRVDCDNIHSYAGLLKHCNAHELERQLVTSSC